jgi:hypothetical protein
LRVNSDVTEPETQLDVNATKECPSVGPEEFPAPIGKLLGLNPPGRKWNGCGRIRR